jgi:hypothetical protein
MKTSLKLLPLLFLYVLIFIAMADSKLDGDEIRFYQYAINLTEGFYTSSENPVFHNGPAYPLFLAPFVALKVPVFLMIFMNVFFAFFGIVYFYKALLFFTKGKTAIWAAYALGLYYPFWRSLDSLSTEPLAFFFVCAFLYFTIKLFRIEKRSFSSVLWPALCLGGLILTKFFFGNVAMASLVFSLLIFFLSRKRQSLKFALVIGLGFILASPYLAYTYSKTGRLYYWSTNGGELLYWMSSPVNEEWGQWFWDMDVLENRIPGMNPIHQAFFSELAATSSHVERNDLFMKKATEQIKAQPEVYFFRAFVVSPLRLFFGYPNSYKEQNLTIYFYLLYHMFLIVLIVFSLYPAWVHRRSIPTELYLLILFILIYLGGTILVCCIPRYLIPAIPFMILWIAYVYSHFVTIKLSDKDNSSISPIDD